MTLTTVRVPCAKYCRPPTSFRKKTFSICVHLFADFEFTSIVSSVPLSGSAGVATVLQSVVPNRSRSLLMYCSWSSLTTPSSVVTKNPRTLLAYPSRSSRTFSSVRSTRTASTQFVIARHTIHTRLFSTNFVNRIKKSSFTFLQDPFQNLSVLLALTVFL